MRQAKKLFIAAAIAPMLITNPYEGQREPNMKTAFRTHKAELTLKQKKARLANKARRKANKIRVHNLKR